MQNEMLANYADNAVTDLSQQARFAQDDKMFVTFYIRPVHNEHKSAEAGRPIFDEREFVRIMAPGDRNNITDTYVNEEYKFRFASRYERFKKGLSQAESGTPLEQWPQMTVGMVAEFKAYGVNTVEQLADMSDTNAQKFMGSHMWRQKAQAFLDLAKGEAENSKLASELEKRDNEISLLKEQMAQLMAATKESAAVAKPTAKA